MDLPLDAAAATAAAAARGCTEAAEAVLELRADLARDELWAAAVRPASLPGGLQGSCCDEHLQGVMRPARGSRLMLACHWASAADTGGPGSPVPVWPDGLHMGAEIL